MSDAKFESIVQEFFSRLMRLEPVYATYLGIHEYDSQLPSGKRSHYEEKISLVKEFREKIEEISPEELSREKRMDWGIAKQMAELELFRLEELRFWEKMTQVPDTVGDGFFLLLVRDFAPLEKRLESISSRLEQVPRFESEFRETLSSPVRLWNEIQAGSASRLPTLFKIIESVAVNSNLPANEKEEIKELSEKASEALKDHAEWLYNEIIPRSDPEFAIGKEKLEKLLRLRGIELTSDQILEIGERYLRELKKMKKDLASKIDPNMTPDEVLQKIKELHPKDFREALEKYQEAVQEAKRFVIEKDFATIPEGEKLLVVETPPYLRHLFPFALYMPPAKFDLVRTGIYMVTPPETKEMLREHNFPAIENKTIHEGYPGHHLQMTCATLNPSLVRCLVDAPEFIEGWAFYCEELVKDLGFHDDPVHRLIMVNDLIWRAARIIVDVKLQRKEMTFDEAVEFLIRHTGMERDAAISEVRWYTMRPSYPLSYLLGKHLILELKEELAKKLGKKFDLKKFHDTMLYAGSLPFKYMKELVIERLVHS